MHWQQIDSGAATHKIRAIGEMTAMGHLTEEEIAKLLTNRLQPDDQKRIVRHLLAGCGHCGRKLVEGAPGLMLERAAGGWSRQAVPGSPRERALSAAVAVEARWRMEDERLNRSLELLRASPQAHDAPTVQRLRGLRGAPLVKALLHRGFELRYTDRKAMKALACQAVQTAEGLRGEERAPALADLQAAAWAGLGNAYRLNDEFAEAEAAFRKARAQLRAGTGDLLLLARVADLEASLRIDQRRLPEACGLLDRVHRLYLQIGDPHLAGRALLSRATSTHYGGNPTRALPLMRQSLSLIDPERDSQLSAIGQLCLLDILIDRGELREAGRIALAGNLRQIFMAEPLALLKLRALEGRILAGIGKLSSAERALALTREEFLQRGHHYEAALVGLDLLPIMIQRGSHGRTRSTARELYGTFRDLGIHHEAAKARRYLG